MLKRLLALLISALPAIALARQVIAVDDAHLQMEQQGAPAPITYKLKMTTSVVLDATNYVFHIPDALVGRPINSVQVVIAKNQRYSTAWDPAKKRIILSSETLKPSAGSVAFSGFPPNHQVVIGIGNLSGDDFNVVWVGLASFQ
jgi:hypothetical protein